MDGKIVFEGTTKKGTPITIRYPTKNDVQAMLDYINMLSKEQTFIRFQGEELTLEFETNYLNELLKKFTELKAVHLLVFTDNNLIGSADINLDEKVFQHNGVFGITVAKDYRGEGIGTLLMEKTLEEAVKELPDLKLITLGAFATNPLAIQMYEKFGFKEYGTLPEGIVHKGEFIDYKYMFKKVR
jgi:ribosomal protein S18 acetylase RimI-like enzyme